MWLHMELKFLMNFLIYEHSWDSYSYYDDFMLISFAVSTESELIQLDLFALRRPRIVWQKN